MEKCKYADKYQAKRAPTCGCDICGWRWVRERLSHAFHATRTSKDIHVRFTSKELNDMLGYAITKEGRSPTEDEHRVYDGDRITLIYTRMAMRLRDGV